MPSSSEQYQRFQQLRTLTKTLGADALFLLDANVLMHLPTAWTAPARGARAPIFAIAECTYEEIVRMATEAPRKNEPEHVKQRRRLANSVLHWLVPSPDTHALLEGVIRDGGNWIMLSNSQVVLAPGTVKYFGEGDAGLLRMAEELQSQRWAPPVAIISDDRAVRLLGLPRQLKCLEPSKALDSSVVRAWLDSISPPVSAITVRSLLEAAPKLCLAEIDVGIAEAWSESPADIGAKIQSERVTVGIMVSSVESEEAFATKATGWGIFLGQGCAGRFGWEATTEISDDGGVETRHVIDFQEADTIPAYVVQGIRDVVERRIFARRLYPPDHVAYAWFHAIFVENGIEPLAASEDILEPFNWKLGTFGSVVEALEDCQRRWPDIDWPDASDFVQDVMHHICPAKLIFLKLVPESVDS